jgi:lysophospholipase L1-like esterase
VTIVTLIGKVLGRVALAVLGLILALLVLEGGVRLMGIAPPAAPLPPLWEPHPYMGWFHIPNGGGLWYSEYGEYQADVHINARGLRDREIGYDNPQDAYRILVLGDSYAEGLHVTLEETFAKQLESRLEGGDRPVEVINGGVSGWGTDQEAIFYAVEGFRYEPDLVLLLLFTRNDILNNYGPLETARVEAIQKPFFRLEGNELVVPSFPFEPPPGKGSPPPPLLDLGDWLRARSASYRLITPYLRNIPSTRRALGPLGLLGGVGVALADEPDLPVTFEVYRTPPSEEWEQAWALTAALIRRLDEEVQSRDARLGVIIVNAPEQVYDKRWTAASKAMGPTNGVSRGPTDGASWGSTDGVGWDPKAPNRRLAAILDEAGVPYLDLLPAFREAATQPETPPLYFRFDFHWTPDGHALAAQAVEAFLREQGFAHGD